MTFIQKLITIITILVVVSVAIAWSGINGASSLNDHITNLIQVEAKKINLLGRVAMLSESLRKNEKNIILSKTVVEINEFSSVMKKERADMDRMLIEVKEYIIKPENRALIENLQNELIAYDGFIQEIEKLSIRSLGTTEDAVIAQRESENLSVTKGREIGARLVEMVSKILESNDKVLRELDQETTQDYNDLKILNLIIALGGIGIAILVAFFMVRQMMSLITSSITGLGEGAEQVASAATQISDSSQQLAEGAQEQAASVEEVTSSLAETRATVDQNAQNAREADILSKDANDSAKLGYEHIQELTTSMAEINESSRKIANIIKTIDEIAFQTNLLALNAAVEAARAGEHGLGFAVVAEEVRNLAQRSAEAAKSTADIIEQSIEQVRKGNSITSETNKAFEDILDKVKKVGDITGEIALASKEQATGVQQISEAMVQVDQITQTMASNSEESAAASEEMSAQAVQMKIAIADVANIFGIKTTNTTQVKSSLTHHVNMKKTAKRVQNNNFSINNKPTKKPSEIMPLDEDDIKEF